MAADKAGLVGNEKCKMENVEFAMATDGLPIIPPTDAAVAEFLKFTDMPPDHSLGASPPL